MGQRAKKLYKKRGGMIFGVCLGLSDYLGLDVTIIRIIWAVLILCAGVGLLAYIIAAILIPFQDNV